MAQKTEMTLNKPQHTPQNTSTKSGNHNAMDARFWDRIAAKYAKSKIADEAGFENTLKRVAPFIEGKDVLELGCGTGTAALRLAHHAKNYLATDISPAMIAIARDKQAAEPSDNLRFYVATARTAALPNAQDVVLGFNYLHLVDNLDDAIQAVATSLKSGGSFITKTPCIGEMNALIRIAIPVMRFFGKAPSAVHSFTEKELIMRLQQHGFEIEIVERHGTKGKDVRPFIVARKR